MYDLRNVRIIDLADTENACLFAEGTPERSLHVSRTWLTDRSKPCTLFLTLQLNWKWGSASKIMGEKNTVYAQPVNLILLDKITNPISVSRLYDRVLSIQVRKRDISVSKPALLLASSITPWNRAVGMISFLFKSVTAREERDRIEFFSPCLWTYRPSNQVW